MQRCGCWAPRRYAHTVNPSMHADRAISQQSTMFTSRSNQKTHTAHTTTHVLRGAYLVQRCRQCCLLMLRDTHGKCCAPRLWRPAVAEVCCFCFITTTLTERPACNFLQMSAAPSHAFVLSRYVGVAIQWRLVLCCYVVIDYFANWFLFFIDRHTNCVHKKTHARFRQEGVARTPAVACYTGIPQKRTSKRPKTLQTIRKKGCGFVRKTRKNVLHQLVSNGTTNEFKPHGVDVSRVGA